MALIKADIGNIYIDQKGIDFVLYLIDLKTNRTLPISIGPLEANIIAYELEGKKLPRPLTHDLLINTLSILSYKIESIEVYNLKNNIYYANINITNGENFIKIDGRPSDAIALAIRSKSPIYVEEKLFNSYTDLDLEKAARERDEETLKEYLENFDIEDTGSKIM